MPRFLLVLALTGLGLVGLARTGAALVHIVPDDVPTLQEAIDSGADTVLVRSGLYADPVNLGPEHALLLAGHPDNATRPRIASITIVHRGHYVFRALHFESRITLHTTGDSEAMAFEQCRLDAGLVHYVGDISDLYDFRFTRCRISGQIAATPASTVFDADTLVGGSIAIGGEGTLEVMNCRFQGSGGTAIAGLLDYGRHRIHDNVISGYEVGVSVPAQEFDTELKNNVFTDISGTAMSIRASCLIQGNTVRRCGVGVSAGSSETWATVADNVIEDCGMGIVIGDDFDTAQILRNRILRCIEHGIRVRIEDVSDRGRVLLERNLVGRSGGDGILLETQMASPIRVAANTVYLCRGSGFHQIGDPELTIGLVLEHNIGFGDRDYGLLATSMGVTSRCNDWHANGLGTVSGATSSEDLDVDPRFCDLARDDARVASDSPVLAAPCGAMGALGVGCVRPVPQPGVHDLVVTPCDLHGWTPLPGSETAVRLSEAFPHPGGSLEFEVERTDAARGWRLPVERPRLSELSSLSIDVLRASATHARRDAAPQVRLLVESGRDAHRTYLVSEPRRVGVDRLPVDEWTHEDLLRGRFVAMPVERAVSNRAPGRPATLAEWLAEDTIGREAVVLACDIVLLPIDGSVARGAADRLNLGFGDRVTSFDFELRIPATIELLAPPVSSCGSPVILAARVVPAGIGGEVEFFDGDLSLGAAPTTSFGAARLTVSALALGTHAFRAKFRGAECVNPSVSTVVTHEVQPGSISLQLRLPALQASVGDVVPLVAVLPPSATGEVTFLANGQEVATAPVIEGYARAERLLDHEGPWTFVAIYSGNACLGRASSTIGTLEVRGQPSITIEDVSVAEGNGGQGRFDFSVYLSHRTLRAVTVDYATQDGTADPEDYTPVQGTLTFPPNTLVAHILVQLHEDFRNEPNETFTLHLSNPSVARLQDSIAVATLRDDDPAGVIVAPAQIVEGTRGLTVLEYPVRMASPHPLFVVDYATYNGWASAPDDFVPTAGTLTFQPTDSLLTFPITIIGDSTQEGDERFGLNFWWTAAAGRDSASTVVTILNDDGPPSAIIEPMIAQEGNGTVIVDVRARLSNPTTSSGLLINYWTRDGSAVARSDYFPVRSDGVVFAAYQTEAFFQIAIIGDTSCEPEESFTLVYELVRDRRVVQQGSTTVTIRDDDCAASAAMLSATAEPTERGIVIQWRLPDEAAADDAIVERASAPEGPWRPIVTQPAVDSGVDAALDADVRGGIEYWYRVTVRTASDALAAAPVSAVAVAATASAAPAPVLRTGLDLVAPNPAAARARIEYTLARAASVRVSVIDVQGRAVAQLADGILAPGRHVATWNGEDARGRAPAGLYFVRCEIDGRAWTRRLVIAR